MEGFIGKKIEGVLFLIHKILSSTRILIIINVIL
jgi:hypothetical protein